jgi:hypothetical protein
MIVKGDSRWSKEVHQSVIIIGENNPPPAHQTVTGSLRIQWGMSQIYLLKMSNASGSGIRLTHASIAPAVVPAIREWIGFSFLEFIL